MIKNPLIFTDLSTVGGSTAVLLKLNICQNFLKCIITIRAYDKVVQKYSKNACDALVPNIKLRCELSVRCFLKAFQSLPMALFFRLSVRSL